MTEISIADLTRVTGGFDEQQLRSYAAKSCPQTYAALKNKSASQITRADAERCVNEAKPNFLMRGMIESQLDGYFKK